jgi:hypothetical protein
LFKTIAAVVTAKAATRVPLAEDGGKSRALLNENEFHVEDVFATVRGVPEVCGQDVVSAPGGAVCVGPLALTHQGVASAGNGLTREANFLLS